MTCIHAKVLCGIETVQTIWMWMFYCSYWDASYDDDLIADSVGLQLLYVQVSINCPIVCLKTKPTSTKVGPSSLSRDLLVAILALIWIECLRARSHTKAGCYIFFRWFLPRLCRKLVCDSWLYSSYKLNDFCLAPPNKVIDKIGRPSMCRVR